MDKIEYIFKNGCYRMGSSSFLINVQSGYVSMSFFANSNQCKDEVDAYYSVKCNTTSVIPYYNKQDVNYVECKYYNEEYTVVCGTQMIRKFMLFKLE